MTCFRIYFFSWDLIHFYVSLCHDSLCVLLLVPAFPLLWGRSLGNNLCRDTFISDCSIWSVSLTLCWWCCNFCPVCHGFAVRVIVDISSAMQSVCLSCPLFCDLNARAVMYFFFTIIIMTAQCCCKILLSDRTLCVSPLKAAILWKFMSILVNTEIYSC